MSKRRLGLVTMVLVLLAMILGACDSGAQPEVPTQRVPPVIPATVTLVSEPTSQVNPPSSEAECDPIGSVSRDEINISMNPGDRIRDLVYVRSNCATQFALPGYPTGADKFGDNNGIHFVTASGGITPGASAPIEFTVNEGVEPGTYTGIQYFWFEDANGVRQEIGIPVRVVVSE